MGYWARSYRWRTMGLHSNTATQPLAKEDRSMPVRRQSHHLPPDRTCELSAGRPMRALPFLAVGCAALVYASAAVAEPSAPPVSVRTSGVNIGLAWPAKAEQPRPETRPRVAWDHAIGQRSRHIAPGRRAHALPPRGRV